VADIASKLDQLADLHNQQDRLSGDKQALVDQVLTPEVRERLAEIEAEFESKSEIAGVKIATLEAEIKAEVLAQRETVKGGKFQAVWNKGRQSWDDKGLTAYAESHPEVMQFRKQGEPSVTIRKVGKD
jgi:hypothetical protein